MVRGKHVSPAQALPENWQRGITPKILMPELWILCMTLDPLKLYLHMKFHFNSISWTRVICKINTNVTGKVWRTDRQTDRQTDDGKMIPKCHLCLQQVTQKPSFPVTSEFLALKEPSRPNLLSMISKPTWSWWKNPQKWHFSNLWLTSTKGRKGFYRGIFKYLRTKVND